MRQRLSITIAFAFILSAIPDIASAAPPAKENLLLSLPQPVRQTVLSELRNGTLNDVSRTNNSEGEVVYEIEAVKTGKERDLTIAVDGRLLDTQIYLDEAPAVVRKAILTLTQGCQLGDITKDFGNDNNDYNDSFEVEMTCGPTNRAFTLDSWGQLQEWQVFLPETPLTVQQTIRSNTFGSVLGDITKTFDEDDVSYVVELTRLGKTRSFSVSTNGELEEEQVFLEETPPVVQKAIQAQAKRGHLGEINKSTDEGQTYYEAKVTISRHLCAVTFDANGAFQSEEDDVTWAELPATLKRAVKPQQGAAGVTDITRVIEGTNTTYEIELRDEHTVRTLTFAPDGSMVKP